MSHGASIDGRWDGTPMRHARRRKPGPRVAADIPIRECRFDQAVVSLTRALHRVFGVACLWCGPVFRALRVCHHARRVSLRPPSLSYPSSRELQATHVQYPSGVYGITMPRDLAARDSPPRHSSACWSGVNRPCEIARTRESPRPYVCFFPSHRSLEIPGTTTKYATRLLALEKRVLVPTFACPVCGSVEGPTCRHRPSLAPAPAFSQLR